MKYSKILYSIIGESGLQAGISNDLVNFIKITERNLQTKSGWEAFLDGQTFLVISKTYNFFHEGRFFCLNFKNKEVENYTDNESDYSHIKYIKEIQFGVVPEKSQKRFEKMLTDYKTFKNNDFGPPVSYSEEVQHKNSSEFWNKIFNCISDYDNDKDIYYSFAGTPYKGNTKSSDLLKYKLEYTYTFLKNYLLIDIKNALRSEATINIVKYFDYLQKIKTDTIEELKSDKFWIKLKKTLETIETSNEKLNNNIHQCLQLPSDLKEWKLFEASWTYIFNNVNQYPEILEIIKDYNKYSGFRGLGAIFKIEEEIEILHQRSIKRNNIALSPFALQKKIEMLLKNLVSAYKLNSSDINTARTVLDKSTTFYDNISHLGLLDRETFGEILKKTIITKINTQEFLLLADDFEEKFKDVLKKIPDKIFVDAEAFGIFVTSINLQKSEWSSINLSSLFTLSLKGLMAVGNTRDKVYIKKLIGYGISERNIFYIGNTVIFKI